MEFLLRDAGNISIPGGFTVLMPVYWGDDPQLLGRAIRSVLANTLVPDAILLVIDGPVSAATESVISLAQTQYPITTMRLPRNLGLAGALNTALPRVQTAWIARADADDENVPDRFAIQAHALARAGGALDVIGGWVDEYDHSGVLMGRRDVPLNHASILKRLSTRNPFNHMTVIYRTGAVARAGGYPAIHLMEDYALWSTMATQQARFQNVPAVLVNATAGQAMYRRRGGARYIRAEASLQALLVRHRHKGLAEAVIHGFLRMSVFASPPRVRGWLYRRALRRQVANP